MRKFMFSVLMVLDKVFGTTIQAGGYGTEVVAHIPIVKIPIKIVDGAFGYVIDNFLEGRQTAEEHLAVRGARAQIKKMQKTGEALSIEEIQEIATKHGLKSDVIAKIVAQAEAEHSGAEGSYIDESEAELGGAPATA